MPKRKKQSKLTRSAKGEQCTVHLFPYCDGGTETTVLAHFPHIDGGMGTKGPDEFAAYACYPCHQILDGHVCVDDISPAELQDKFIRGVQRTQKRFKEKDLMAVYL